MLYLWTNEGKIDYIMDSPEWVIWPNSLIKIYQTIKQFGMALLFAS